METRVQYLSSEFLDLQEKDKKFIAGDLLYVITSLILSLKSGAEDILHIRRGESEAALFNFEHTLCNLQTGIQKVEEILAWVYPPTLDDPGIMATIRWYCHEFKKGHPRFQIAQEMDVQEDEIGEPLKKQLFRILQEALGAIAEHGRGDRVRVSVMKKGFQPQAGANTVGRPAAGMSQRELGEADHLQHGRPDRTGPGLRQNCGVHGCFGRRDDQACWQESRWYQAARWRCKAMPAVPSGGNP